MVLFEGNLFCNGESCPRSLKSFIMYVVNSVLLIIPDYIGRTYFPFSIIFSTIL